MKEKKHIIIFIILISLLLVLGIYNIYSNRKLNNVDRKIKYIINDITVDSVYNRSNELFLNAINILNEDFEYEKDANNHIKYYSIKDNDNYQKILNYPLLSMTFKKEEISKYITEKKIIEENNNYYIIKNNNLINPNYVGSILEINSYDNNYVYFNSTNYYCNNSEFKGILYDEPECNYWKTNSNITISIDNNYLRISNIDEIKNIIK